jgi:hypothetical protein
MKDGERILRLNPGTPVTLYDAAHTALVVLDCRAMDRMATEQAILAWRSHRTGSLRGVALVRQTDARIIEVVGRAGNRDIDVLLADDEFSGHLLRAMLNDVSGTVGTSIALDAVRRVLAPNALVISQVVLGSGCTITSVKGVSTMLRRDRSALAEDLADEGSPYPERVIRLCRAAYATVLIRCSNLTFGKVAEYIGYTASRWMQVLLASEFGMRAEVLRALDPDICIEELLGELLDERFGVGTRQRNGGGRQGNH